MTDVIKTSERVTERRLHLPVKALGDNFYPYMYGVYRSLRIQAMAAARVARDGRRDEQVKQARKLNRECLWYLHRTTRSLP